MLSAFVTQFAKGIATGKVMTAFLQALSLCESFRQRTDKGEKVPKSSASNVSIFRG